MMSPVLDYRDLTAEQAVAAVDTLKPIYAAVFSQPPYHEGPEMADKFVGWVCDESTEPGFAMVVAYGDEEPVGFAYGYTMPAGRWWRGADRAGPPEVKAADKFAVMEWAVLPEWQGQGIGLRLLDDLLDERPEPFGVLTVNPAAPARAIYERLGWHFVGSTKPGKMPGMDILVARLNGAVVGS